MGRYYWYNLEQNGKIVGEAATHGQANWIYGEIKAEHVYLYLEKMEKGETKLDEFNLTLYGWEGGPIDSRPCGYGIAHYSKFVEPIVIKDDNGVTMVFEDVTFIKKCKEVGDGRNLKEVLLEWIDIDGAQYELARCLGIISRDTDFVDTKHFWWSNNDTGDMMANMLEQFVKCGLLEKRTEPDIQYRWKGVV